jgi:hypothetical protein
VHDVGAILEHAAVLVRVDGRLAARKVLGWPKRCQSARAFLWEYSFQRLKLTQLLGQLEGKIHRLTQNSQVDPAGSSSLAESSYIGYNLEPSS